MAGGNACTRRVVTAVRRRHGGDFCDIGLLLQFGSTRTDGVDMVVQV